MTQLPQPAELEKLAATLSSSPDYRVLRRLPVRELYHKPDGTPVKIGVILDTETTGLDASDRVIELGMLRFEFDPLTGAVYRILDSYGDREDPGIRITESATAVHGITAQQWSTESDSNDAAVKRVAVAAGLGNCT